MEFILRVARYSKIDCSDCCETVKILKPIVHFKWVSCMVCELALKKKTHLEIGTILSIPSPYIGFPFSGFCQFSKKSYETQ